MSRVVNVADSYVRFGFRKCFFLLVSNTWVDGRDACFARVILPSLRARVKTTNRRPARLLFVKPRPQQLPAAAVAVAAAAVRVGLVAPRPRDVDEHAQNAMRPPAVRTHPTHVTNVANKDIGLPIAPTADDCARV
jgi:hypothetical protein|mmetsp:Transcript_4590/g.6063  ORF Transcript_4590/g.6063 Transcript_4590/m.6063 type:complete len:135 (+) Transcript_4590:362-766(+)